MVRYDNTRWWMDTCIKYDFNQATTGNYALQNAGGVTYTNQSGLNTLSPNGYLYECLNMRDIIRVNKTLGDGSLVVDG